MSIPSTLFFQKHQSGPKPNGDGKYSVRLNFCRLEGHEITRVRILSLIFWSSVTITSLIYSTLYVFVGFDCSYVSYNRGKGEKEEGPRTR